MTNPSAPIRLPAEWEPQDAILLAWPHPGTDWAPLLSAAEEVYCRTIAAITKAGQRVVLIACDPVHVRAVLERERISLQGIALYPLSCDDTWTRDFGPMTVYGAHGPELLDFVFNGWGNKFSAERDNVATARLAALGAFGSTPVRTLPLILEGGSIESDGCGTLLTTSQCLLTPTRNPHLSKSELETTLLEQFGAQRILWLDHGHLQGDDTDAHIDTLARFAPNDTIVYQGCDDATDEHYQPLQKMARELGQFRTGDDRPYRLFELPLPQAQYDDEGQRLPATYANFLVINRAVLVPTYADPADSVAQTIIGRAFPERTIIGIDCRTLIQQHGSLHCITMQIPRGVVPCAR